MLKKILVCIIIISLLTGCIEIEPEMSKNDRESVLRETTTPERIRENKAWEGSISKSIRENEAWEDIERVLKYVGKSANDIAVTNNDISTLTYIKKDEGEQLISNTGYPILNFIFSDKIWSKDSYCRAIQFQDEAERTIPRDIKDFIMKYGGDPEWHNPDGDGKGYFQYDFDDGVLVKFYINEEGSEDDDMIIISYIGEWEARPEKLFEIYELYFIDMQERKKPEWKNVNFFAGYLGKSLDELKGEYPDLTERHDGFTDSETDIDFMFWGEGTCQSVDVPAYLFFEELATDGHIDRAALVEYWPVDYTWTCSISVSYLFQFDDIAVDISSEADGTLRSNSRVHVEYYYY